MSKTERLDASDIQERNWLLRAAPEAIRPFLKLARLDRPIGTWLLLFPCWWSLALAARETGIWPQAWPLIALHALFFAVGALAMRGAGCTFNDLVDRDIDAKVARTATRPLASGRLSPAQGIVFLVLLCLIGLAVLVQFNATTIALGAAALLLVAGYPFMKRITYWPQAWLGLTFNWGAILGWTSLTGSLDWPPVLVYLGGIAWTIGYDTIYALQDKEDDALVGVKSTALKFGAGSRRLIAISYAIACALFAAAGASVGLGILFFVAIGVLALFFAWQVATLDMEAPTNCLTRFRANRFAGWILLAGVLLSGPVW